jgi:uncharacterized membrane protein YoaT (DUF817 family)
MEGRARTGQDTPNAAIAKFVVMAQQKLRLKVPGSPQILASAVLVIAITTNYHRTADPRFE